MEWVETTGRTVAEALDAAMDQLGVDENEVEYQIIQEAKSGLFGKVGGKPARIRARVKPISREKPGDRQRSGRGRQPRRNDRKRSGGSKPASTAAGADSESKAKESPAPAASGGDSANGGGGTGPRSPTAIAVVGDGVVVPARVGEIAAPCRRRGTT